jgi:hypothetical protein
VYSDPVSLETWDKRFYGVYRGIVVDNSDPENLVRLRVQVPQILGQATTNWAWGILPAITDDINIPEPGTGVWVMFEGGDPNFPLWLGVF